MPRFPHRVSPASHASRSGFALIIALALVVLVAISVVAFLSSSMLNRQISTNSTSQARADIFAKGALSVTLSDLQQEIVEGSTASTITTGTVTSTLYLPKSNATMVPYRVGGDATLPNLVKRSVNNTVLYPKGTNYANDGPARAANSSSATISRNSRSVPLSEWNKALLLPKKDTTQSSDLTPNAKFTAPDWIYLARDGSNPTAVSADIVGRYAYAIYDEGGLLNINVAGYPSTLSQGQAGRKVGAGTADLTVLGLTTSDVDAIVGWRTFATSQPAGNFPSYTFNSSASTSYYNYLLGNSRGFLTVGGPLWNSQSDRLFGSRQQLIQFLLQGVATTSAKRATFQNALQYLGTFSRDLDQPAFFPSSTRPKIVGPYVAATDGTLYAATSGGNRAYGLDDTINPSFLALRASSGFSRNDGSKAAIGEPLVKKRFLLNRLCWLTYKGPSGSLSATDAIVTQLTAQGIPLALIQSGTAANIVKYFGLTWNATSSTWNYSHGITGGIGTLSDVQGLARDPDFFELLKAGMVVGSLAKGASSNHNGGGPTTLLPVNVDTWQYNLDTDIDVHVLQIGANIIDQIDADSYPTHLTFSSGVLNSIDLYGVENLPYLYRARVVGMPVELPAAGTSGKGALLLLPEVWNPHDPNAPVGNPRPTNFRFLLAGNSLTTAAKGTCWVYSASNAGTPNTQIYNARSAAGGTVTHDSLASPTGLTELDFSTATASACQQPVFLGNVDTTAGKTQSTSIGLTVGTNNNARTKSYADSSTGYIKDVVSNLSYCGVLLGEYPLTWTAQISASSKTYYQPGPYTIPLLPGTTGPGPDGMTYTNSQSNPSTGDGCILSSDPGVTQAHYILQYQAGGNWVTYQDNYSTLPAAGVSSVVKGGEVDPASNAGFFLDISSQRVTGSQPRYNSGSWLTWLDPRSSRFGAMLSNEYKQSVTCSSTAKSYFGIADRPTNDYGMGVYYGAPGSGLYNANPSPPANQATSQIGWYPGNLQGSVTKLFVPGYYAENTTIMRISPPANAASANYFTDPDGVVRRGMAAYVSSTAASIAATATSTVGMPMATLSGTQSQSRPFILNRPFRSVAELGYVYSGTPWRNLDFFTPESGAAPLLDLFCTNETSDPNGLTDGRVNLNTRQPLVLNALLSGSSDQGCAYKDELNAGVKGTTTSLSATEAANIAAALVARTSSTASDQGPLSNLSELVGKWNAKVTISGATAPHNIDGKQSYTGFSADLATLFAAGDTTTANVQRFQEGAIRALAASGQTRVWNLMIDVVAQVGRYPANETSLDRFVVDGERHYWLHVAIDRYTGAILDKQLEQVNE